MGHVPAVALFLSLIVLLIDAQSEADISNTLEKIFSPMEVSLQTKALRRDIMQRLYDALQRQEFEDDLLDYKRSISSLAKWDNLPGKRNLAALAREGYIKTIPDDESDDKRSLANLAKNGQLPQSQAEEEKRGIEALARNGELHHKREIQELIDELYDKRNIGSLARSYNFPSYGKRYLGSVARGGGFSRMSRNLASLAREGVRYGAGKRNVAALLRQDKIHGPNDRSYDTPIIKDDDDMDGEKRNLASIKAAGHNAYKRSADGNKRTKRQADYYELNDEYATPVYQNGNIFDYEELLKALTGEYPNTEKRFLGSVARSGWFRPASSSATMSRFTRVDKRHIGALARLGWLPSFRSVRRFNRSGRSITECDREAAADGEAEDYALAQNTLPVNGKRFLLQPVLDRVLLEKMLKQAKQQQ